MYVCIHTHVQGLFNKALKQSLLVSEWALNHAIVVIACIYIHIYTHIPQSIHSSIHIHTHAQGLFEEALKLFLHSLIHIHTHAQGLFKEGLKLLLHLLIHIHTHVQGLFKEALKLFLQVGESALDKAIEVVGAARNDVLTHTLVDYLMGEHDRVPKDPNYIFRLYMALGNFRQVCLCLCMWVYSCV